MTNKFMIKLLSVILLVAMLAGSLFACFDNPVIDGTGSSSSTTIGGLETTTRPTTSTSTTTTRPTTSTSTTTTTTTRPSGATSSSNGGGGNTPADDHWDVDNNGWCDDCGIDVVETVDFYNFNDLHGKFENTDDNTGVDELTTYLENRREIDEHTVFLSTGDMWQGGSASNGTHGRIITDWMNYLGFEAMALGNHEFDWGTDAIRTNVAMAEFSILAINVYDNATGKRADFCEPSVMIERGGAQIGIIGAIGDCYSSISGEMVKDVHFKTGTALTNLVKAESDRLREEGADVIIYLIHDGTEWDSINVTNYYDLSLSSGGYVDVVFGGHTHSYYITEDAYGVPHLQGGGDNSKGMTHVELDVNFANGDVKINATDYVQHSQCSNLPDSPIVQELLNKYWSEIGWMYDNLGYNARYRDSDEIADLVAKLYYQAGKEKWGNDYDIVLGGGFLQLRSPYEVNVGNVVYGDLQMILPFDNQIVLCKVKGSDLLNKFYNSTNSSYHIYYENVTAAKINRNSYYYIIVDSYTSQYAPNNLTEVARLDSTTFARDLLADYIMAGNWDQ